MSKKIIFLVFFAFAMHAMDKPIEERLLEKNIVKPVWIIGNDESVRWKLDRSSALHSSLVKFQADMNPENTTFFFPLHLPTDKIDFFLRTLCKRYPPISSDPIENYLVELSQFRKEMEFENEFNMMPQKDLITIAQVAHAVDEPKLLNSSIKKYITLLNFISLNGYEPQKTFLAHGTIGHELPDPIADIVSEQMVVHENEMLTFWSLLTQKFHDDPDHHHEANHHISHFDFVEDTHLLDNYGFVWDLKNKTNKPIGRNFTTSRTRYSISKAQHCRILETHEDTITIFDATLNKIDTINCDRGCSDAITPTLNCTGNSLAIADDIQGGLYVQDTFKDEFGSMKCKHLRFSYGAFRLQFHPTDPSCLFTLYPNKGMFWSMETLRPSKVLLDGMKLPLINSRFSPCGTKMLLMSNNGIYIWNITRVHPDACDSSRKKKKKSQSNFNYAPPTTDIESSLETQDPMQAAEYNPDGSLIAITHTDSIRIWTANLANQLRSLKMKLPSPGYLIPAKFSPNGQHLAIGICDPEERISSIELCPLLAQPLKQLTLTQMVFLKLLYKNIMSKNVKKLDAREYPAITTMLETFPKNLAWVMRGFIYNAPNQSIRPKS